MALINTLFRVSHAWRVSCKHLSISSFLTCNSSISFFCELVISSKLLIVAVPFSISVDNFFICLWIFFNSRSLLFTVFVRSAVCFSFNFNDDCKLMFSFWYE
uniref:AsIV-cont00044-ORF2 n=1 Tax=Apophua simplicipes ichnovirus TaxID=1329648 RepID=S5DR56_9VIRU|nr:AsIV-cont00044-ORF2 [Apophua simplicipes ichnovirus]